MANSWPSIRVEVPDSGYDDRPIQLQTGGDRVHVCEDGSVIVALTPAESEGLRHQLRGAERSARYGGSD